MAKVRVESFGVSMDGFGAGPNQDLQNPLGVRGPEIFEWAFPTRVFRTMHGQGDGETGIDNEIAQQGFAGIGAWILGRNMFGPVRGPWPDESWKGWWGEEPPYHTPAAHECAHGTHPPGRGASRPDDEDLPGMPERRPHPRSPLRLLHVSALGGARSPGGMREPKRRWRAPFEG